MFFYKWEKSSGQSVPPIKIKTVTLLYHIMAAYYTFCSFKNALDIFSQKMELVSIFQKSAKTDVKTFQLTKIEKQPLL